MGVILDAKPRSAGSRTVFVCSEPTGSSPKRRAIWIMLIGSSVLIAAILFPALWHHAGARHATLPAAAGPLVQFQQALYGIDKRLEAADMEYRTASHKALRAHDLLGLFDATNGYEARLDDLYKETSSVRQPDSKDARANAWARVARDTLLRRIGMLRSANHQMVEAVDKGALDSSFLGTMEKARASADIIYDNQRAAIRRTYEALGISRDAIPSVPGSVR